MTRHVNWLGMGKRVLTRRSNEPLDSADEAHLRHDPLCTGENVAVQGEPKSEASMATSGASSAAAAAAAAADASEQGWQLAQAESVGAGSVSGSAGGAASAGAATSGTVAGATTAATAATATTISTIGVVGATAAAVSAGAVASTSGNSRQTAAAVKPVQSESPEPADAEANPGPTPPGGEQAQGDGQMPSAPAPAPSADPAHEDRPDQELGAGNDPNPDPNPPPDPNPNPNPNPNPTPTSLQIGGEGGQTLSGDSGANILIGGHAGSVRNYQFEFWDVRDQSTKSVDMWSPVGGARLNAHASLGWSIPSQPERFDSNAQSLMGAIRDVSPEAYPSNMEGVYFQFGSTAVNYGHYDWQTVANSDSGGGGIEQQIITQPGTPYQLAIEASALTQQAYRHGTSFKVSWNGDVIGVYDGRLHEWIEGTPATDGRGTTDQTWTFDVMSAVGVAGYQSLLQVHAFHYTNTTVGPLGGAGQYVAAVEQITLTPVSALPDHDTIVGGDGSDLIWGQGGNDVLRGDREDGHDGQSFNVFVYSMREHNGDDVIEDFRPGVDRLALIDMLDTAGPHARLAAPPRVADGEGRLPTDSGYVPTWGAQPSGTTAVSDTNLTADDLRQSQTARQYLLLLEGGNGDLFIDIIVDDLSKGTITLKGVAYGSATDTVDELVAGGFLVLTQDGFSERLLALPTTPGSTII